MIRVSVIGLGAMGASYAARLAATPGVSVAVIAGGARAAALARTPVTVNGQAYRFDTVDPAQPGEPADLVIVAVKYPQFPGALADIAHHVGPGTTVISLLNGISSEAEIAAAYPDARVLLSITFGVDAVRHGHAVTYSSLGAMAFGEPANTPPYSEPVRRLAGLFDAAGLAYEIPPDMVRRLWWKFLVNTGVNQVTAVLGAPYRIVQEPGSPAYELMLAAQREVIAVARARGVGLDESDIDAWLRVLAGLGPGQYTSMAQDILAGRRTEVDLFGGAIERMAAEAGVAVPVNACLVRLIRAKEALAAPGGER